MAEALDYLHAQRFLHRDICPRNAMVTEEGQCKLIDFGLTVPWTAEFCKPGNRTGTTDYLAPEVIKRQTTDNRVDLYALGITAFELFTFQIPWERGGDSAEKFRRFINTPPREPTDIDPTLPEPIARFLVKATQRDPALRFQTAAQFRDACQTLINQGHGDEE